MIKYFKIYSSKNNLTFINIINIVCAIIIIYLIYLLINNKNSNKDTFYNAFNIPTEAPTTTIPPEVRVFGKDGPTTSVDAKSCSTTDDVLGFCMDYENCCSGSSSTNCICTNPIVTSCKKTYDECMADPNTPIAQLRITCSDKNKTCCSKYSNTIDKSLFNPSVIGQQTDNVLCDIEGIKNIDTKCLELCQTNPSCVAYSLTELNCKLHNKATYQPPTIKDKKNLTNDKVKFITKK
jgi:hypothetical protein